MEENKCLSIVCLGRKGGEGSEMDGFHSQEAHYVSSSQFGKEMKG